MDRDQGYAAHAAGALQDPAHLSRACLLQGYEPVPTDRPFRYIALGRGQDSELSRAAAGHPHASFYAAACGAPGAGGDAAPRQAAPSNLTLLKTGLADLAPAMEGQPPFDFIVLRGDYDRLPPEGRRHVVDFIVRHLNPGGIVHVGYNALPGGSTGHPLQRLLLEYQAAHAEAAGGAAAAARRSVQALAGHGAAYFDSNPGMRALWEGLKDRSGDGLNRLEPLYFADVARAFAAAKLDFVGAATPPPAPALTAQQREFLDQAPDPVLRETLKDYLHNTAYRSDLFVRGARRMHPLRRRQWEERLGLTPADTHNNINRKVAHELE
ncbi:methyltransferase regulatory domain-containing protein [Pseudoduganella namucuonensis]|uniref:Predicted methyltransferase regulatory domain-containing protein n=1 Tax=Pseudoduganella namucuonensis TaxID=1035707 RepID=A0A1I7LVY4_9BURK|nr:methyltransferase regulatory domain-containing protein [Pseudoduganella namucuonensis]SFV13861.1 Predicted methyltransferase regulatory domain-containing protein [Pseudoduganella namucuonensis]